MSSAVKAVSSAVSGVTRSVSKVVSGAVDAIKGVTSKTVSAVKDAAGSKFGKLLITAAAIYFGGAALAGGFGSSAAGGSFLSGMGTGVANAASSLSTAWGSAMAGEFGQAGSALSSGFQGQAAGAAGSAAGAGAQTQAQMLASQNAGIQGASEMTTAASNTGGGLVKGAMTTPAGSEALTNKGMYDAMTGAAKVTGGMQLAGNLVQGIGAQKAQEEQRAFELQQQRAALDRVNQNVGSTWWNAPAAGGAPMAATAAPALPSATPSGFAVDSTSQNAQGLVGRAAVPTYRKYYNA